MVTDHAFLSKVFGVFDFWTFFLSIFEIPKILCPKIFGKKNKLGKQLKEHSFADKYIFSEKQLKDIYRIHMLGIKS